MAKRKKNEECSEDEFAFYATRIDESIYLKDSDEGRDLLRRAGGKIYAVYVWTPDIAVHIASLTPSAELNLVDYVPESWPEGEEEWEEWDRIKDELLRDSELVTYMDYPAMKRYLTDKKNAELIGCFENADDAIEHYHGNPRYNNPITSTSVEVSDGARLKLKNRLLR